MCSGSEILLSTGAPFPPNFLDVIKTIFKRLFRVYAHIYHSHFQMIIKLEEEAHLNTCFKHFMLFTWVIPVLHLEKLAFFLGNDNCLVQNRLKY
jgi:MOB kinase activator 1